MFTPSFSRIVALCSTLASAAFVSGTPQSIWRRGQAPAGPKFVVYTDLTVGPNVLPTLDQIKGFNVV